MHLIFLRCLGKKSREKKSSESSKKSKQSQKKKSLPGLEFDTLDLYSDLEDFVEEFEDLLSTKPPTPKKRCLRSSSTEEKETSLVSAGSSVKSVQPNLKKTEPGKKTSTKSGKSSSSKKSGGEKSSSKSTSTSKKTGSCASNR